MSSGFMLRTKEFILVILVIWIITRIFFLIYTKKIKHKSINIKIELVKSTFVIYVFLLISIVVLAITIYWVKQEPLVISYSYDIIPFKSIIEAFKFGIPLKILLKNLIGNVVLTVPLGIFFPILFKTKLNKLIMYGICISVLIEFLQFLETYFAKLFSEWVTINIRASDINDVILNTIGVVIGYFVFITLLKKKFTNISLSTN